MSNPCQCGKPAHDGVLCPQCGDDLRNRLRLIADRWTDLEAALTSSEPGGEKGHTKNGMIEVGTTLNEAAVKARRDRRRRATGGGADLRRVRQGP